MNCTRCGSEGFTNLHQIPDEDWTAINAAADWHTAVIGWIAEHNGHDVSICDCCGNGEQWYGIPGEHNFGNEPFPECF